MCVRFGSDGMCDAYKCTNHDVEVPPDERFRNWVFPPITRVCEKYKACWCLTEEYIKERQRANESEGSAAPDCASGTALDV